MENIHRTMDKEADTIIIGDTNIDKMKWTNPEQRMISMVNTMKTEIETLGYIQMVKNPTRFWINSTDSLLDQIWTKNPDKFIQCRNISRGVGDHNMIEAIIRIKGQNKKPSEIIKRSWKNTTPEEIRTELGKKNWQEVLDSDDPILAYGKLEENLVEVVDRLAPNKRIQVTNRHKNWITERTRKLMEVRENAKEVALFTREEDDWEKFKKIRNKCTLEGKKDRNKYFKKIYEDSDRKHDTKTLYRTTREQLGWQVSGPPTALIKEGELITKPKDMANLQIETFYNKVENLRRQLPNTDSDPTKDLRDSINKWEGANRRPELELREVTLSETAEAIKNLGNSGAQGHDRLDSMIVKIAASILLAPIKHVVNISICKQIYCPKWKIGKLVPLFKGKPEDRLLPTSYRPISILPVISKIVERLVKNQVMDFMERTGQLNSNCHAYRKLLGTVTALLEVNDDIYEAADDHKIAVTMTIDQSSAFDCVRHEILDKKLELYKFSVKTRKWFASYLGHRSQYVSINTKDSELKPMNQGVPQGSVLGPLIFVIYLNELPTIVKDDINCSNASHKEIEDDLFGMDCPECGRIICYSDDSTFVGAGKSRAENQAKLDKNMPIISDFLTANGMAINQGKTKVGEHMVKQKKIRVSGEPPTLVTQNKRIETSRFIRLLGGNIQDDLTWRGHLELGQKSLLPAMRSKIGALKLIGRNIGEKGRRCIANGLIVSKLLYLLPVWGGTHLNNVRKTQCVLNRAARVVLQVGRRVKVRDLMDKCQWLYVRELEQMYTILALWKILRQRKPGGLARKFNLDDNNFVSTNIPRLQIVAANFRHRSVSYWNKLPQEIRDNKSLPRFKKCLKAWIVGNRPPRRIT